MADDKTRARATAASTLDAIADQAQRALEERPSISIRTRVSLGFVLWLVLSLGMTAFSMFTVSRIQNTLSFLEAASNYTIEIQQARRFEKNYFLYHTNLADALEHVQYAQAILDRQRDNIATVVGLEGFHSISHHLIAVTFIGAEHSAARSAQPGHAATERWPDDGKRLNARGDGSDETDPVQPLPPTRQTD